MIIPILLLILGTVITLYLHRAMTLNRNSCLSKLENKEKKIKNKYEFMISQKKNLKKELNAKEQQLETVRNSEHGIKTISTSDIKFDGIDDDEKVSRYLIQQQKITLEQNEKIRNKMEVMKMDFLGTCLALGFIDLDMAKKVAKVNKVDTKSL